MNRSVLMQCPDAGWGGTKRLPLGEAKPHANGREGGFIVYAESVA